MEIINVIQIYSGIIDTITSFPTGTGEEEELNSTIQKIEKFFLEKAKEIGFNPEEYETEEDILDDGYYEGSSGKEVHIIWSHEIISPIQEHN